MRRRRFVQTALFGLLAARLESAVSASCTSSDVLAREDIETFATDMQKLQQLKDGFAEIYKRDLASPIGWFNMAAIHEIAPNDPQGGVYQSTLGSYWHQCHNDDSVFFAWHRIYVLSMEMILQAALQDPCFRLPYWDWHKNPALPKWFRDPDKGPDGQPRNPLFDQRRDAGVNGGSPVWTVANSGALQRKDFASMQDRLNSSEHGWIHTGVMGGTARPDMGTTTHAARDPVFWLHHANIDRLLVAWHKQNSSTVIPPSSASWAHGNYHFPRDGQPDYRPSFSDTSLANTEVLKYRYSDDNMPTLPPTRLPPRPQRIVSGPLPAGRNPNVVSAKAGVDVSGVPLTVHLAVDAEGQRKLSASKAVPRTDATVVAVVLDEVTRNPEAYGVLGYRVYLNLPDKPQDRDYSSHYLGSISLFDLTHSHGERQDKRGATLRFDASEQAGFAPIVGSIDVSIVPEAAPGANPSPQPVIRIGEVRLETSLAK
jgi:hypothetical protein